MAPASRAEAAMIKQLSIRNYKSLENIELPLGPLTVLVGANGSGKSNILDALAFLQQIVGQGNKTHIPLGPRGGYSAVVWGGDVTRDVSIEIVTAENIGYSIELAYMSWPGYASPSCLVKAERIDTPQGSSLFRESPVEWRYRESQVGTNADESALRHAVVSEPRIPGVTEVLSSIQTWAFYHLNPRQMRGPKQVRREYRLTETGENLSTVIHTLFSDRSPRFGQIFEILRGAVPTVEELLSPIVGDGVTDAVIRERDVPSPIGTWGMSDGTLFALALAVALLTPEPPSLLALEAPDTELHPYVMELVAEMLKSASLRTQVLTTTHSPYLLNHLPPESLVIVEKVKGKTTCRAVSSRRELKKIIKELGGAGEAWYAGHLGGIP